MTDKEFAQITDEGQRNSIWCAAFWASLDPAYEEINPTHNSTTANTESARAVVAAKLQAEGFPVDRVTMVWGMSPYYMMLVRRSNGQDTSPYEPNVLPKPFNPPAPPPMPDARMVGDYNGPSPNGKDEYICLPAGIPLPKGQTVEQGGVTYRKFVQRGLMGNAHWFEKA